MGIESMTNKTSTSYQYATIARNVVCALVALKAQEKARVEADQALALDYLQYVEAEA